MFQTLIAVFQLRLLCVSGFDLVRSANFELRRISSIRHLLSTNASKILVSAFVLSRLDYCNSLLVGCSQYLLNKLQKVQNNAARLVLRVS